MLMPGVAFSKTGGRMGHGMGYYDKYLTGMFAENPHRGTDSEFRGKIDTKIQQNKTVLIGLSLKQQIVSPAELPLDPHDVPLDDVIFSE